MFYIVETPFLNIKKGLHRDIQAFLVVFYYSQNTIYYLRDKGFHKIFALQIARQIFLHWQSNCLGQSL